MRRPLARSLRLQRRVASLILCLLLLPAASSAQTAPTPTQAPAQGAASVAQSAPVYLRPDDTLTPLRVLPAGTLLTVRQTRGPWVQVTFSDPQFGFRTGWMLGKFVSALPAFPDEPAPPPEPTAEPAPGQPRPGVRPIRRPVDQPGGRVFGAFAADRMTAADSFNAVLGRDTVPAFGGGFQAINLWHGIFAEVAVERSSEDGERVFIDDGEVFRLGVPLTVTMTPIDVIGGWRQRIVSPYLYGGAGLTFLQYRETSEFADEDENLDENYRGFVALAGVEVPVSRWIHIRGEVRYRRVDDVLGLGGVSAAFNERELGGVGFGLKIAFGR